MDQPRIVDLDGGIRHLRGCTVRATAILVVFAIVVAGCSGGGIAGLLGSEESANVSAARLAADGRTLLLEVDTCNAVLIATVSESQDSVVLDVTAHDDSIASDCADGLQVVLDSPLAGRRLIDRYDDQALDVIPESLDRLWSFMMSGDDYRGRYSSIEEMVAAADLIILGTVSDIAPGREWRDPQPTEAADRVASLFVEVSVVDVISGQLPDVVTIWIEHPLRGHSLDSVSGPASNASLRPLPNSVALWYLYQDPPETTDKQSLPAIEILSENVPYRIVASRGVILNQADGSPATPLAYGQLNNDPDPADVQLAEEIRQSEFEVLVESSE